MQPITLGTRSEVERAESLGTVVNAELYVCEKGDRKFSIGQWLQLFGLQEYPELNGHVVQVTAYRDSLPSQNAYYIKSQSSEVEKWLNFVWEKRLRLLPRAELCPDCSGTPGPSTACGILRAENRWACCNVPPLV